MDVYDRADFIRDELRDTSSCPSCGFREPVRLGRDRDGAYGCDHCRDYGRCYICRRWTYEEDGAAISRLVQMEGAVRAICDVCWEKGDEGISLPLDMTDA